LADLIETKEPESSNSLSEKTGISPQGNELLHNIAKQLRQLIDLRIENCLSAEFRTRFSEILENFEKYQSSELHFHNRVPSCQKGCASCCCHWVEDVNSFEAVIICDFLRKKYPDRIPHIIRTCKNDENHLRYLDELTEERFSTLSPEDAESLDVIDVLLGSFYQMKRPCPLLDSDNRCMVYPVRPLTCRVYMSFSPPHHCLPENIHSGEIPTYLLDMNEETNSLLDTLHFMYQKHEDDTGLRSLLLKSLSQQEGYHENN